MADEPIPIMRVTDIVELLSEWGMNISAEEMTKPTAHTAQAIYDEFVWQMLGTRLEDLEPSREIIMQDMEHPELYTEAVRLRMFYHLVRHLVNRAGVDHFSFQDIARPDGLRLRQVISIIRNLLAFRNERMDFMESMTQKLEDATVREDELLEEEHQLQEKYNELLRQRAAEDAKLPAARAKIKDVKRSLDAGHHRTRELKKEADRTKLELRPLKDRLTVLSVEQETSKNRNARDQGRIIQSPDRLRRTIANLATSVEQERQAIEQNKAKARDYQAKLSQLTIIEQDFRMAEDLLAAIQTEQERLENCNSDLHTVRTHYNNRLIEHRELKTKAEQLERQLVNARDKFERLQRATAEKREASMQKMEMLKEKFAQVDKERSGMLAEHDLLRQDIEGIENEMVEYIKTNEALLNALMAEYWNLRHDIDGYMGTLTTKFGLDIGPSSLPALAKSVAGKKRKGDRTRKSGV